MPRLQSKSFATPDDESSFPLVHFATVALDDASVGHCRFEPGWRWSETMGPMLGTTSCPMRHLGYTVSGSIRVVMDDGQALDIGPDEVFDIPPGHDKWVLGDEPWVTIEWGGSGRAVRAALEESPGRMLATVVFTDIVDSTARVRKLGDVAWRDLLSAHNGRLREQLKCSAAGSSRRPATACSRSSTARPGRSGVPPRWWLRVARWAWRSGSAAHRRGGARRRRCPRHRRPRRGTGPRPGRPRRGAAHDHDRGSGRGIGLELDQAAPTS